MARHGSLAEQLAATLAWRNRPETEGPLEAAKTNWSTVPANDNNPEDVADFGHERKILVTPSVGEIMRQCANGDVERGPDVWSDHFQRMVPGPIVRIGSLRFSDGTQTEKAYINGPDGRVIRADMRMPVGAMLKAREATEAALGGKAVAKKHAELSNAYFAEMFGVDYPRYVPKGKMRREEKISEAERVALLAGERPEVTVCPPGLPCGTRNVGDSFVGLKKAKRGESGSIPWADLATLKSSRECWRAVMRELRPATRKTLEKAATAKTLADIGGKGHKRTAERRGKRLLAAANDDLAIILKKYAS